MVVYIIVRQEGSGYVFDDICDNYETWKQKVESVYSDEEKAERELEELQDQYPSRVYTLCVKEVLS